VLAHALKYSMPTTGSNSFRSERCVRNGTPRSILKFSIVFLFLVNQEPKSAHDWNESQRDRQSDKKRSIHASNPLQIESLSHPQAEKASEAKVTWDLLQAELAGDEEEEGGEAAQEKLTPGQVYKKAAGLLLAGAALAGFFADPLVDSIGSFSAASNIPPFFVAFVVSPQLVCCFCGKPATCLLLLW
jgi:Ca2+/H+ antiporter